MKKIYTKNNYLIIEFDSIVYQRPKSLCYFVKSREDDDIFRLYSIGKETPDELKSNLWTEFVNENDLYFADINAFENFITSNTGNFSSGEPDPLNETGQVKANYTGLILTNFSQNVPKTFDINSASATLAPYPITKYPNSTVNSYAGLFDATRGTSPAGRLIENEIEGQVNLWRIQGKYSGKGSGNNGALDLTLRNTNNNLFVSKNITLPSGRTLGTFDENVITISNSQSVPSPNGFVLQCDLSFSDSNLIVEITSITRISLSVKY